MITNSKLFGALAVLFAMIAVSYIFGSSPLDFFNQTAYLIFPVLAAVCGFFVAKIYGFSDANGRRILMIALGFTFWALGDILWYLFTTFLNINPFPSVADVFYLLGYPLVLTGIYLTLHQAQIGFKDLKKISNSALVINVLLVCALIWIVSYYGIYQVYDSEAGTLYNFFSIGYGVADLILIIASMFAFTIISVYRGGKLATFWLRMIVGFLLFLIADILFALFDAQYEAGLKPYIYIDLIYIASYLFFTYGMLIKFITIHRLQQDVKKQLVQENTSVKSPTSNVVG